MRVVFESMFYFEGPVRHLYRIFEIYKALGDVFSRVGIEVKYFVRNNEIIPLHDTITEEQFYKDIDTYDLVFMWNGQLAKQQEIAEACRARGIPIYFSELGWLPQNGTFYFDRKGSNYAGSFLDWEYFPISKDQQADVATKLEYYHRFIEKHTGIEDDDFVFVPFQVEDDSQILHHSPRFKKMQVLVDYVSALYPGKIVFKCHPKHDAGEIRYPARCKLYRHGTTADFISRCKYVVTINSTVGVEALAHYKPVINLGNAFYEGRKMTYKVTNAQEFKAAVEWAEKGIIARGAIEAFLWYLFDRQWHTAHLKDPKKVLGLIEGLTNLP